MGAAPPGLPVPSEHPAPPELPLAPPLSLLQRLAFRILLTVLWVARRLPDKPIYRSAFAVGAGLSLLLPARRRQVRQNLARVCAWLVANDMAIPRVAAAARDPRALERMVRDTFGHWVVTYAEAALGPRYSGPELKARFVASDPAASSEAISARPPGEVGLIHMAMHFGSVDLSALYGSRVGALPVTGPMEFVESPFARAYFDHVRFELGVTIVPVRDAAEHLIAALQRGEAVGVVADRNIVGSGVKVDLFGAPVRLPIGPAVLSVQTGAPIYLQAIERTAPGEWLGHTVPIRSRPGATRRGATRSIIEQQARAFERIVARAPEQWTTLFFPIWNDEDKE
jgi:phosphatidylinositol dimannoside acyltransferase